MAEGQRQRSAPLRLGLLASHGGSNLAAILDASRSGRLPAEPRVVIVNNSRAPAFARAQAADVPVYHLSSATHPDPDELDRAIAAVLEQHGVELVALAGYMKRLGPLTVARWHGRIVNIHPALLPRFGGQGMYGMRIHEAVLAAGETVTGVTIHLVDEEYDNGPVVAQTEVPVQPGDTPETLAARVLRREHEFYVETLARISQGELALPGLVRTLA
ncbi:MAG: phosphoribosylglycinamide formyltransferase [Thermomicrobiales bacterium]